MNVYNCHTHVFNMACAPERFLDAYAGRVGGRVLRGVLGIPGVTGLAIGLGRFATHPVLRKYLSFLQIGTDVSQVSIFENKLAVAYPAGTRFVVLAINFDYMGAGAAQLNYASQLWQLLEVRKRNPNTCLPFLSVDPRMGTADQNRRFVETWVNRGFVGLKLYPSLGFYPFDARLDQVYAFAQEHALPVIVHCNKGGIYFQDDISAFLRAPDLPPALASQLPTPPSLYGKGFPLPLKPRKPNDDFCDYFLDPRAYDLVLARFPELKLCLAHYGGEDELAACPTDPAGPAHDATPPNALDNWYAGVRWLLRKYPNTYTDVSYTLAFEDLFPRLLPDLSDPLYQDRLLFGTDFFMTERQRTERELAVNLMKTLQAQPSPGLWERLANRNPTCFLHSDFYTPVERAVEPQPCRKPFVPGKEPGLTPLVAVAPLVAPPVPPVVGADPKPVVVVNDPVIASVPAPVVEAVVTPVPAVAGAEPTTVPVTAAPLAEPVTMPLSPAPVVGSPDPTPAPVTPPASDTPDAPSATPPPASPPSSGA